VAEIDLASPQFQDGGELPREFTCEGKGGSPALSWPGVPPNTREIALLVDDPDAREGEGFAHWTLWGISPDTRTIPADKRPPGSKTANNGAGTDGWIGACPPEGEPPHRYVFSLRALDTPIDGADGADAGVVRDQIEAATIGKGELTATYAR
jgi:Raf kinase inhibitor-like YbhB/YbcL family protein